MGPACEAATSDGLTPALLAVGGLFIGLEVHRAQTAPGGGLPAAGGPAPPTGPAAAEPVHSGDPAR